MRGINIGIDGLVDELLVVLAEDARQMKLTLVRLNELREAVIKREEDKLRGLLDTIREEGISYGQVENRRHRIRKELAGILGCSVSRMNLSRLCEHLTDEKKSMVMNAQAELRVLVEKLKTEHTSTGMLLKECSKYNSMLLKKILGKPTEVVTYNSQGSTSWESENNVVNFKL